MKYIITLLMSIFLTAMYININIASNIDLEKSISDDKKTSYIKNKVPLKVDINLEIKEVNFSKKVRDFNCNQNETYILCTIDNSKYQFNNLNTLKMEDILLINDKTYSEIMKNKGNDLILEGSIVFGIVLIIGLYVASLFNQCSIKKNIVKKTETEEESVFKDLLTIKTLYIFIGITVVTVVTSIFINESYSNTYKDLGIKNTLNETERLGLKTLDFKNNQLIIFGLSSVIENSTNYLNSKGKMINGGSNRVDIFTNNEPSDQTICYFDNYLNCDIQGKKISFNVMQENFYINNVDYKTVKTYIENKVSDKQENFYKIMKAIGIVYLGLLGLLFLSKTFFRIF